MAVMPLTWKCSAFTRGTASNLCGHLTGQRGWVGLFCWQAAPPWDTSLHIVMYILIDGLRKIGTCAWGLVQPIGQQIDGP